MSEFQTIHDEMAHFQSLWVDAMQKQKEDAQAPKSQPPMAADIVSRRQETKTKEEELDFQDMIMLAEDLDRVFYPERYESRPALTDVVQKAARSPNPVHPTSVVDKDQDLVVTPNFSDGDVLRELHDLKLRIESLERQLHAAEIGESQKSENNLQKEVESLRSKIEELSEKLTPHIYTNPN